MKCVVWAGGLTSRSPSRPLSGQLTFWPALAMREVGESSADCLAALAASVIKGLRREEAGQATDFSKRAFSHFFSRQLFYRLNEKIFTICVPVAVPILYDLITLSPYHLNSLPSGAV